MPDTRLLSALSKVSYSHMGKQWFGYMPALEAQAIVEDGAVLCNSSRDHLKRGLLQAEKGINQPGWFYFTSLGKHTPVKKYKHGALQ